MQQQPPVQQAPQNASNESLQQPVGEKSPLDALQNMPQQPPQETNPVNVVEVEGAQNNIVHQQTVQPGSPAENALSMTGGEQVQEQNVIEESLEELKEEYDDAKLNSIIIEQVKELIEIDTNLNNKIEDVRIDLKKEIEDREKLQKQITDNYQELKELEKSIDKFIALYELVTNQFNPFVKQDDPETKQKMQELMQETQNSQQGQPAVPKQNTETDFHFVTKTGARVKSIGELATLLETMSDEEFNHHVTPVKNDFAAWIHHAVKNEAMAAKIMPLKTKSELLAALKEGSVKENT